MTSKRKQPPLDYIICANCCRMRESLDQLTEIHQRKRFLSRKALPKPMASPTMSPTFPSMSLPDDPPTP